MADMEPIVNRGIDLKIFVGAHLADDLLRAACCCSSDRARIMGEDLDRSIMTGAASLECRLRASKADPQIVRFPYKKDPKKVPQISQAQ